MVSVIEIAIFTFCLIGCGISSWFLGRIEGIRASVEYLAEAGYIELEEEDQE